MQGKALIYKGNKTMDVEMVTVPAPGEGEVILKVAFCGICGTDRHIFHGIMDERVQPPKVVGHEMSGTVEAAGPGVTDYKKGDKVTFRPLDEDGTCIACRMGYPHICQNLDFIGIETDGAFQQYWKVQARLLHRLPVDMDLKLAALAEPLAVACHDVSRAELNKGDRVAVIGGGPIGMLIALLAQYDGADVRLLEINGERRAFAESMGITTIDSLTQDPVQAVSNWTNKDMADVVFEVSASKPGAALMTALARPRGTIVLVGIFGAPAEVTLKEVFLRELNIKGARVYAAADFDRAITLLNENKVDWGKLISRVAPMEETGDCFKELDDNPSFMKVLIEMK
jgi:(R,R)-butanediol dehydrogenase/meso-butanediol dehydrogenase/diacetyl reductase